MNKVLLLFLIASVVILCEAVSAQSNLTIYGTLRDENGQETEGTVILYEEGTANIVTSNQTTNGYYNLSVVPGTYDIMYVIDDFFVPNFSVKVSSIEIESDLEDIITCITGREDENKVIINISKGQIVEINSSQMPKNVSIDGIGIGEVQTKANLTKGTWYYDSFSDKLYIRTESTASATAPILKVDFDDTPVGSYSSAELSQDWGPGLGWSQGIDRCAIVDGADTYSGNSLRMFIPSGTNWNNGGAVQFKVDLGDSYDELYLSYWIKFESGFDFDRGGKLPGLIGGEGNTGGDKPNGYDGWSGRGYWHQDGKAVIYVYHPDQPSDYGEQMFWDDGVGGQRYFQPGEWHQVEHRIVMNTPGQSNGLVQCWFDGELSLDRRNMRFRYVDDFAIDTFFFSTFFGGSWTSTKDEYIYFDDFVISTEPITH